MAIVNGTPVNFGFSGGGITITGLNGILLQSADHASHADLEEIRNAIGDVVTHIWHNFRDEAQLDYIVTGTSISNAVTNTALQTPGTILSITACASMPSLVGTHWEVQSGAKIAGSNVNSKKITLPIRQYAGITAAAT